MNNKQNFFVMMRNANLEKKVGCDQNVEAPKGKLVTKHKRTELK